ncbi:MAG: Ldh family oxidoreductase [Patescibacteria group bacterium]
MRIAVDTLRDVTRKAILHYGYTESEAAKILEVLLYAQLRGNNQGVVKLIGNGIPKSPEATEVTVEKDTKLSALLNAHGTHAMIAVNAATDLLIEKVKAHSMGIVGVNHITTSSGAIGYYAKRIAEAGFIGFVFAGSMESVAAYGSFEALFGTNPLAVGVPTKDEPLVLDMATSAMAYFGVVEANTAGRELPADTAFDKEGNPTTHPKDVLDGGALRTFDQGPKGSGLSMIVQALTGPLVNSYFTGIGDVEKNWGGHLLLAFDPELLGGLDAVREGVTQMIAKVKATKKTPGTEEIFVPGEHGNRMTHVALASGTIEIEENLYAALKKVIGE